MKVLVVYAHPNPESFNHAILKAFTEGLTKAGHTYEVSDLYAGKFDPCLSGKDFAEFMKGSTPDDIQAEQDKVSWADALVFIHPVWWTGPPAILKGWIDRVFSLGFAYDFDEKDGNPIGLLKHKKALLINTAGATEEEAKMVGATEAIKKTEIDSVFKFCGIKRAQHVVFYNVTGTDEATRKSYLQKSLGLGVDF